jgi:predicted nucleic acid-binding protein
VATPVRRIVNASPLILLAKAGQLDLLRAGVPEVVVPDAVLREVSARGPADPVLLEVRRAPWLKPVPAPATPPEVLVWDLGDGESSVLSMALNDPDCETILDDRDARRCAQAPGIGTRGTIGLIVLARQIGSIPAARPVLEQVRRAGLFVTDDLVRQALALVGE